MDASVIHTCIAVSDPEASLEFYGELGLERTGEFTLGGVRNVYVGGDEGAEIQFRHDPERTDPIEPEGMDHLAVAVDDCEAAFEELRAATDCGVRDEPTVIDAADAVAAFVYDPDGYVVELVEYR
jgi:lactoylglutathione lyase